MQNFTKVQNCADTLRTMLRGAFSGLGTTGFQPALALVLGTGLGNLAALVREPKAVPFGELPDFPVSRVESHAGQFVAGFLDEVPVIIQQGRCHLYEGHSAGDSVLGVRVMAALGAKTLIVTNAAGALNPQYERGGLMVISDHINFTGASPLTGVNDERFGPRFPDMSAAYDAPFLALARDAALAEGIRLEQGVYLGLAGPQMETPAETRAFRLLGADAVGMSTVLEVLAARHLGMRVLGFSCLTNKNLPDCMEEAPLETVIQVAGVAGAKLTAILKRMIPRMV